MVVVDDYYEVACNHVEDVVGKKIDGIVPCEVIVSFLQDRQGSSPDRRAQASEGPYEVGYEDVGVGIFPAHTVPRGRCSIAG